MRKSNDRKFIITPLCPQRYFLFSITPRDVVNYSHLIFNEKKQTKKKNFNNMIHSREESYLISIVNNVRIDIVVLRFVE